MFNDHIFIEFSLFLIFHVPWGVLGRKNMNLLFRRSQTGDADAQVSMLPFSFRAPSFKLWAKIELTPEELAIVSHYRFEKALLIDAIQPGLLKSAALAGFGAFVLSLALLSSMFPFSSTGFLAFLIGCGVGYIYFDKKRESVWVRDLMAGRYFACTSIIDLARKEAWLEAIVGYLRQVMKSAETWDGTETIPIKPMDKDAAKRFMVQGL